MRGLHWLWRIGRHIQAQEAAFGTLLDTHMEKGLRGFICFGCATARASNIEGSVLLLELETECELARRGLTNELDVLNLQALGAIDFARVLHKGSVVSRIYAWIVVDHSFVGATVQCRGLFVASFVQIRQELKECLHGDLGVVSFFSARWYWTWPAASQEK